MILQENIHTFIIEIADSKKGINFENIIFTHNACGERASHYLHADAFHATFNCKKCKISIEVSDYNFYSPILGFNPVICFSGGRVLKILRSIQTLPEGNFKPVSGHEILVERKGPRNQIYLNAIKTYHKGCGTMHIIDYPYYHCLSCQTDVIVLSDEVIAAVFNASLYGKSILVPTSLGLVKFQPEKKMP